MRDVHRHHLVDLSFRPFDERGVAVTIRKAGSSTVQGPVELTLLYLRHLDEHGLVFLTELFNLSVAGVDIPAIWRTPSYSRSWKRRIRANWAGPTHLSRCFARQWRYWSGSSSRVPTIVEALRIRLSQHGFKPRHSTTSALLFLSARVVSGFNQRKPQYSRTIAIAVDILKAFDTVSQRFLNKLIHRYWLRHNLARWLVAYRWGRKALCLYQ